MQHDDGIDRHGLAVRYRIAVLTGIRQLAVDRPVAADAAQQCGGPRLKADAGQKRRRFGRRVGFRPERDMDRSFHLEEEAIDLAMHFAIDLHGISSWLVKLARVVRVRNGRAVRYLPGKHRQPCRSFDADDPKMQFAPNSQFAGKDDRREPDAEIGRGADRDIKTIALVAPDERYRDPGCDREAAERRKREGGQRTAVITAGKRCPECPCRGS